MPLRIVSLTGIAHLTRGRQKKVGAAGTRNCSTHGTRHIALFQRVNSSVSGRLLQYLLGALSGSQKPIVTIFPELTTGLC